MAKNKISEWSSTPASNTDIGGIDIAEGCAPSGLNNAIREMMAQIKDMQTGADGDDLTLSGTLALTGGLTLDSSAGTSGQVLLSAGAGNTPTWGNAFVAGMIMLWSGSSATIPTGWLLCDGSNSTPDLRNRFVVGAGSTYAVDETGGSLTTSDSSSANTGSHTLTESEMPLHGHPYVKSTAVYSSAATQATGGSLGTTVSSNLYSAYTGTPDNAANHMIGGTGGGGAHSHTMAHTHTSTPPYYALCYIMKA